MPRRQRLFVPGAIYHVYCRVSRGEMVFNRDGEPERLISEMIRVKHRDRLTVFAFVVMSNHYHLALRTDRIPLWRTMLSLQGRFAKGHNLHRRLRGPLWQSRYKARIVEDQSYFDQILAYIHLNPVSARLVDDPSDYQWSGHNEILGLKAPSLVDVDEALASFGLSKGEARGKYLSHLRSCAEARWIRLGVRSLPWWLPVTDNEEIVAPRFGNMYWDHRGALIDIDRPVIPLIDVADLTCGYLGVTLQQLSG